MLAEEGPGWWPDVDLIEHYGLKDYEDSKWETMLLGHKPDGREGLLFPSIPPYVQKNGADGKGNRISQCEVLWVTLALLPS